MSNAKAAKLAPYAMMAANSYHRKDEHFPVEKLGWHQVNLNGQPSDAPTYAHRYSLAYDVYRRERTNEVVFAFRGTDSVLDFLWANFAIGPSLEYRLGRDHFIRAEKKYPGAKFITVGHSLGGGLALAQSVHYNGVDAVVFDASPRLFDVPVGKYHTNHRDMVFEKGEILEPFRKPLTAWNAAVNSSHVYEVNYDFNANRGSWLKRAVGLHSMTKLACGIASQGAIVDAKLRAIQPQMPCSR